MSLPLIFLLNFSNVAAKIGKGCVYENVGIDNNEWLWFPQAYIMALIIVHSSVSRQSYWEATQHKLAMTKRETKRKTKTRRKIKMRNSVLKEENRFRKWELSKTDRGTVQMFEGTA